MENGEISRDLASRTLQSSGISFCERQGVSALIIVVNADPRNLRLTEAMLSEAGHLVAAVSSFVEAKHLMDSVTPDLLVADVRLEVFNGLQLAIRSRFYPDRIDAQVGDELTVHVTNVEQTRDMIHGFGLLEHNLNMVMDPGETKTFHITLKKPGVYPFYCTNFCSALHQEMHPAWPLSQDADLFFRRRATA